MLSHKDKVKHITEAFTYYFIERHWEYFEDDEISHLLAKVDVERLSDKTVCDCSYIRDKISWDTMPVKKLVRCVVRLIDNMELDFIENQINLQSRDLRVKDVIHILTRRPDMLDFLGIKVSSIKKDEAHLLFLLGNQYYLDKLDIKKFNFDYMQGFQIAKAYKFQKEVVLGVSYKKFNNLQVGELLGATGEAFADYLDLSIMGTTDWRFVLERQPQMYDWMNPIIFLDADVFELVKLLAIFDYEELHLAMKSRVKELTPYGVELLLIHHLELYKDSVDLTQLDNNNIAKIQEHHPSFG
jgi:hypothetical protein